MVRGCQTRPGLRDPGYRPEAIALLRRILPQQYAAAEGTPDGVLGRDVDGVLSNDDPRFVYPSLDTMMAAQRPNGGAPAWRRASVSAA